MKTNMSISSNGAVTVIRGRELLTSLNCSAAQTTAGAGVVLYDKSVNPTAWDSGRIVEFTRLFQKWRPRKLTYEYVTSCGTTAAGSLSAATFDDEAFVVKPTIGTNGVPLVDVQAWSTLQDANAFPVFGSARCIAKSYGSDQRWRYCGTYGQRTTIGDEYSAGRAMIVALTALPTGPLGLLYMNYEIEFKDNCLQPTASLPAVAETLVLDAITGAANTVMTATATSSGASVNQPLMVWLPTTAALGLMVAGTNRPALVENMPVYFAYKGADSKYYLYPTLALALTAISSGTFSYLTGALGITGTNAAAVTMPSQPFFPVNPLN
jgi:hypothetical protein